jgi:hypothetical protein
MPASNPDLTKGEPLPAGKPHDWDLGDTAPCDCKKSRLIFERGCEALAKRMADPDYADTQNAITRHGRKRTRTTASAAWRE